MKAATQQIIRFGWIVTSIVLVILIACHSRNIRRIEQLEETNRKLVEELHRLTSESSDHATDPEQIGGVDEDKPTRPIEVFSWDIEAMKKAGLKDPLKDIISDLRQHRELIPFEGSMGGTMNFYGQSKIWILTKRWALAYFEDGHNGGYLLLEYAITKDGEINWKRLASYLS